MCWVSIFIYLIDRKFEKAAVWCLIRAFLSAFGLIHAPNVSLPWEHDVNSIQVQLTIAYACVASLFLICYVGQIVGWIPSGLREDEEPDVVERHANDSFVTLMERRYENRVTIEAGSIRATNATI